jgi:hypothetical protein
MLPKFLHDFKFTECWDTAITKIVLWVQIPSLVSWILPVFSGLYKLAPAGTSTRKKTVGLLMKFTILGSFLGSFGGVTHGAACAGLAVTLSKNENSSCIQVKVDIEWNLTKIVLKSFTWLKLDYG